MPIMLTLLTYILTYLLTLLTYLTYLLTYRSIFIKNGTNRFRKEREETDG